jgi:hypothetical protein
MIAGSYDLDRDIELTGLRVGSRPHAKSAGYDFAAAIG